MGAAEFLVRFADSESRGVIADIINPPVIYFLELILVSDPS